MDVVVEVDVVLEGLVFPEAAGNDVLVVDVTVVVTGVPVAGVPAPDED